MIRKILACFIIFFIIFSISFLSFENIVKVDSKDVRNFIGCETYLIICPQNLVDTVHEFANFKSDSGYFIRIETLEGIKKDLNIDGKLTAPEIRKFLQRNYNRWKIKYLLLIGSPNTIPMFYVYPNREDHSKSGSYSSSILTDFFYSDIQSDIDSDGDGYPGELFDDVKNVFPQIRVGRIPFDSENLVKKILDNIVKHEKNVDLNTRCLIASSTLSFNGESFEGKNIVKNDGYSVDMHLTNVAVSENIPVAVLSEKDGFEPSLFENSIPLTSANMKEILQHGDVGLTIFMGHGNSMAIYRKLFFGNIGTNLRDSNFLWKELLSSTDNIKINGGIFLASACLTSSPNNSHNLGATMLLNGLNAYVGLTSVGWAPSLYRSYFNGGIDSIFTGITENLFEGYLIGDSIINAIANYDRSCKFNDIEDPIYAGLMNIYDVILYGDPTAEFRSAFRVKLFSPQYVETLNSDKRGNKCLFKIFNVNDPRRIYIKSDQNLPFEITVSNGIDKNNVSIQCIYKKNIPTNGLFIFFVNGTPFFIYCMDKKENILSLHLSNKYNSVEEYVGIKTKFLFNGFLYFDVKFDNKALFCDDVETNNLSGASCFYLIDNYNGIVSFLLKPKHSGSVLLKSDIRVAKIHFRVKYSVNNVQFSILNMKTEVNRFENLSTFSDISGDMFGDLNLDGLVNSEDLSIEESNFTNSYLSCLFNPWFDLNNDGIIDGRDIYILWLEVKYHNNKYIVFYQDCGLLFSKNHLTTWNYVSDYSIICTFGETIVFDGEVFSIEVFNSEFIEKKSFKKMKNRVYYFVLLKEGCYSTSMPFEFRFLSINTKICYIPLINYGVGTLNGMMFYFSNYFSF